jgi:aldehyde dehydrogenase (NAD+)
MYGDKPTGSDLMGKMINTMHTKRVKDLLDTAGGTIISGGKVDTEAHYVEPTLILEPDMDSALMKEEIFGPIMPIMPFSDINQVIETINKYDKPLTVYYFGNPKSENSRRLMAETRSGAYVTNNVIMQIYSNFTSFGGVGHSGTGRHGGHEGYKNFCNRKTLLLKGPTPIWLDEQMTAPFHPTVEKIFRQFGVTFFMTTQETVSWYLKALTFVILCFVFRETILEFTQKVFA